MNFPHFGNSNLGKLPSSAEPEAPAFPGGAAKVANLRDGRREAAPGLMWGFPKTRV